MNGQKGNRRLLGIVIIMMLAVLAAGLLFLSSKEDQKQMTVTFGQDGIAVSGAGVSVRENSVVISRGGSYLISGTAADAQIYVDAGKDEQVELILNGVDIANEDEAAIYIENAEHTAIILGQGTRNSLQSGRVQTDGERQSADEEAGGAVIYAKDDLSITGAGSLYVAGYLHNGIHTKNHLFIEDGNIEIEAANHALKGKDSVTVTGGSLVIKAGGKGVESDMEAHITGGSIRITEAAEGIEANQIRIDGGVIEITASDDGINANGGAAKQKKNPSDDVVGKMPNLIITGGDITINAEGDGLDSNGNLIIEGGNVVIDGPTHDGDGALDYGTENGGVCKISGGTALAIGSAGMAVAFDEDSAQCSFCHICESAYEAGCEIVIYDADGQELYRHTAVKRGASVVFSSPKLITGETYLLTVGERSVEITLPSM
ncbi:MAG: carbohydrate-binding domain-containing protein [Bacillus sp. (in: Bacteria)]|nr:carbohydrate-binding domain-containing protein [Bacillus sp. (in: firmicutes)]MCM1425161.1 carbohydrate-binding domain-containing protein [Eubacterium sp.]